MNTKKYDGVGISPETEKKDLLEDFRAWIIRFNRDLKNPELVRKYLKEKSQWH